MNTTALPSPHRRRTVIAALCAIATLTAVLGGEARPVTADSIHYIEFTLPEAGPLGSVSFIGDSVGIGAGRFSPTLPDHLAAAGWGPIRFHGVDGKRTGYPPDWPDYFNAVPTINQWRAAGWDSDTWIINLGANDSGYCRADVACAKASIMLVVDAIGPGHRIWWPKITRLYTHQYQADAWNAALDQVAAERADFFTWDWPAEMWAHPDIYGSWDGTHLYPDGYLHRSAVMAQVFTETLAHSVRTGTDAPLPTETGTASELLLPDPTRILDTRVDPPGRLGAGARLTVDLRAHVPDDATAVAINLTSVEPSGRGYLAAAPCDDATADTSSLNVDGTTRAAPTIVALSATGTVCVTTVVDTDVIVDLQAVFVPTGSDDAALRLTPLDVPLRLLDSRETGRRQIHTVSAPDGAAAVAVNLTLTGADAPGYAAAEPCATAPSGADGTSNVNTRPGATLAGAAFVPVADDGTFCVVTSMPVDLIVDLTATLAPDGELAFVPVPPTRLLDTRDGTGGWSPFHAAGDVLDVRAAPPGARAASGTLTMVRPARRGYLAGTPCGGTTASSAVNAGDDQVIANSITVGLDDTQRWCITAAVHTHTLFDVTGWWVPSEA